MVLQTLLIAIAAILSGMSAIFLSNLIAFPFLRRGRLSPKSELTVSVLIPAWNEAEVIGSTVAALLAQPEASEILLLDDGSTDQTADRAAEAAAADSRFRVIAGSDLPPDWLGKNWACHQLAQQARGDLLIFTDADVIWNPGALASLLAEADAHNADLLTVWPTQQTVTWGERLVVPLMALVVHAYLPVLGVHHTRSTLLAAANGQCMLFRRQTYQALGGHAAVKNNILEDVSLARLTKAAGFTLRMVEGNELIQCRMYRSWRQVLHGYAKNIRAGFGNSWGLVAATLFHWTLFLAPWLVLLDRRSRPHRTVHHTRTALLLALWGLLLRIGTAWRTRQRPMDGLLMPISVLLMTRISAQALKWHLQIGAPIWKDRIARPHKGDRDDAQGNGRTHHRN